MNDDQYKYMHPIDKIIKYKTKYYDFIVVFTMKHIKEKWFVNETNKEEIETIIKKLCSQVPPEYIALKAPRDVSNHIISRCIDILSENGEIATVEKLTIKNVFKSKINELFGTKMNIEEEIVSIKNKTMKYSQTKKERSQ